MIVLPLEFVSLKRYPGYFWNTENKKLYSCKSGVLKPLTLRKRFRDYPEGYRVSVFGVKKTIQLSYLMTLVYNTQIEYFKVKE